MISTIIRLGLYPHLFEPLLLMKLVWVQVWASESFLLRKHIISLETVMTVL